MNFFLKLFIFIGVCAGGYYGYQEYQRRQEYGGRGDFGYGHSGGSFAGGMFSNNKRSY